MKVSKHTAYHEAGHAAMIFLLGKRFKSVTIKPSGKAGNLGTLFQHRRPSIYYQKLSYNKLVNECMVGLSGQVSDEIYSRRKLGVVKSGASQDYQNIAEWIFEYMGEEEAKLFLKWIKLRTRNILTNHWNLVKNIAEELLKRETLVYEDVSKLALKR